MSSGVERKLTTILMAKVEGYSRVMDADEARPSRTPERATPAPGDLRERVIRHVHRRLVETSNGPLSAWIV